MTAAPARSPRIVQPTPGPTLDTGIPSAERALVGGLLEAPTETESVLRIVSARDFEEEAVWWVALAIHRAGHASLQVLANDLEQEHGRGLQFWAVLLAELVDGGGVKHDLLRLAGLVHENALDRLRRSLYQRLHREPDDEDAQVQISAVTAELADARGGSPARGSEGRPPNPAEFFDREGLAVQKLAAAIQGESNVRLGSDGRLYRYRGGVYLPDGERFAAVRVREILGPRFKAHYQTEVAAWLRAFEPTVSERPDDSTLNLKNGVLDWRTATLRRHSPSLLSAVQIPVRWNPAADCPRVADFLRDVLPEDALDFAWELFGYSIYAGNPFRVAVLLLGPGRNGKSVLLRVLTALLGAENVSSVSLQMLAENRFSAAELFGKLANVCGDLDARAVKHTDTFKVLTGGDALMAERKYQQPFTFHPFAVPIFSANEAPISSDQSEAWFDRWLVVPMERRIPEHEIDPHLAAKLTAPEELEGLLVRAVAGLCRLMERGRFDLPKSVQRGRDDYRERLDTVAGFLAEGVVVDLTVWSPRSEVYAGYREWCQRSGRLPVGAQSFNARLRESFADRVEERTREGIRGWAGLRVTGGTR